MTSKKRYPIVIGGKVIKGDGYGRKIGFPTINIDRRQFLSMEKKPSLGIYAGTADLGARHYKAGIVIGPIDEKGLPKIEAHLIGFSGNAYGKTVSLRIQAFIRKFKKFRNEQDLILQIEKDISYILHS